MIRKLKLISATFALMTILFMCALANAQPQSKASSPTPTPKPQNQSIVNTTKNNTKDYMLVPGTTGAKGWDGKVQGRVLVTPVTVGFDNPQDYDNFAAGKLRLSLILRNTLSGQTITLGSNLLTENFRPSGDKKSITVNVVIDNMSAPLSEAACGEIAPIAENTRDGNGVNITLSYSPCGSPSAQRTTGNPVTGVIVHGGKNPGGNMNISLGDSHIVTKEAVAGLARQADINLSSSKGAGQPKNAGF